MQAPDHDRMMTQMLGQHERAAASEGARARAQAEARSKERNKLDCAQRERHTLQELSGQARARVYAHRADSIPM